MKKIFFITILFILCILKLFAIEPHKYNSMWWDTFITDKTHFIICYNPKDVNTKVILPEHGCSEAYAQQVAKYAEKAWNKLINQEGFKLPYGTTSNPTDDSQKIKIYIYNIPEKYKKGYCYFKPIKNNLPVIISIRNELFKNSLISTITHEFFHAIQSYYVKKKSFLLTDKYDWVLEGTAVNYQDILLNTKSWLEYSDVYFAKGLFTYGFYNNMLKIHLDEKNQKFIPYSTVIFWKYFENKGYSIKGYFEKLLTEPDYIEPMDAMEDYLGYSSYKQLIKEYYFDLYLKDNSFFRSGDIYYDEPISQLVNGYGISYYYSYNQNNGVFNGNILTVTDYSPLIIDDIYGASARCFIPGTNIEKYFKENKKLKIFLKFKVQQIIDGLLQIYFIIKDKKWITYSIHYKYGW